LALAAEKNFAAGLKLVKNIVAFALTPSIISLSRVMD
jgi:hypothetical protein